MYLMVGNLFIAIFHLLGLQMSSLAMELSQMVITLHALHLISALSLWTESLLIVF